MDELAAKDPQIEKVVMRMMMVQGLAMGALMVAKAQAYRCVHTPLSPIVSGPDVGYESGWWPGFKDRCWIWNGWAVL